MVKILIFDDMTVKTSDTVTSEKIPALTENTSTHGGGPSQANKHVNL